ncbi:MAG: TolC family protein [Bacteroidota bacterium]
MSFLRLPPAPRLFLLTLLGLMLAVPASAQQRITFNEAVRVALEQNILLQQTERQVAQQAVQVDRARSAYLPSLSLNTNGGTNFGRQFNTELDPPAIVNQTTTGFRSSVSANYTVFDGFGRSASLEEARTRLEARDLDFDRRKQDVVFGVMSDYLLLIQRGEQVRIQQENLEAQRQLLAQIEAFVEVGSRPVSDLFQQQALVASAELEVLNAQRQAQFSEAALIQRLQLDPFDEYEFVAPNIEEMDLQGETYQVSTMLERAYGQRADLEARELDIRAAEQGIRAARSGFWPTISASASYSSRYTDASSLSFADQFGDFNRQGDFGLNLNVPIFDRFNTRNNIQAARVQFEQARLELDGARQDIAVQVRQAYLDYLTAEKEVEVTEVQVRAANQALEAAQERYNVGANTLVELSDAQAQAVSAASSRVQARYSFLFQKRLIDYYLGSLDPNAPLFR